MLQAADQRVSVHTGCVVVLEKLPAFSIMLGPSITKRV